MPWNGQETDRGQLWRSDDGGDNWTMVSSDRNVDGPDALLHAHGRRARQRERDVLPHRGVHASRSTAAQTLRRADQAADAPGGDNHDMWIDPTNAEPHGRRARRGRVDLDQRAAGPGIRSSCRSRRCTTSRSTTRFPTTSTATGRTGRRTAGRATAGSASGGGRRRRRPIPRGMWHSVGGGESGWATPDPVDPEHRLVDGIRLRQRRRHRRALRREPPADARTWRSGPTTSNGVRRRI